MFHHTFFLHSANGFYKMKVLTTTTTTFCLCQKIAALIKQLLLEH